jgi:uncharacterized protein (DUF58 family)
MATQNQTAASVDSAGVRPNRPTRPTRPDVPSQPAGAPAGRRRERLVTPTGWAAFAGVAGSYALGVAAGYQLLVGVAVTGVLVFLAAAIPVASRPRVTVTRTVSPGKVTVGETALGRLDAHNQSRWPAPRLQAVDRIQGRPVRLAVAALAPGGSRTVRYPIAGSRRGLLTIGPVTVERRDPFGLYCRSRPVEGNADLWVRPRVHPLRHLAAGIVLDVEGRVRDTAVAGTASFSSLRDYIDGDDPRHIHWKNSARVGRLMVKEHLDADEPTVTVVLDTRSPAFGSAGTAESGQFEQAVEVAASFTAGSVQHGLPVTLSILGEGRDALAGADPLDRLAAASLTDAHTVSAALRLVEHADPGGCLVVVTGDDEPGLVAPLLSRHRRHASTVVIEIRSDAEQPTTLRHPGTVVLRARTAVDAVAAWNRLVAGPVR